MPLFKCSQCGCVDNTSTSMYWHREPKIEGNGLCSECDPQMGKWHGVFPKLPATGYKIGNDGFLYSPEYIESASFKFREKHQGLKIIGDA